MRRIVLAAAIVFLVAPVAGAQDPPRDARPAYVELAQREAQMKAEIEAEGLTVARALTLAQIQEQRGLPADAAATLVNARKLFPQDRPLAMALAQCYARQGKRPEAIAVVEDIARLFGDDRAAHYTVATYVEEIVRKEFSLSDDEKRALIAQGIAAADRAIALDAAFAEAIVYKNILLRHQARIEPSKAVQDTLIAQAEALRLQAMELMKNRPAPGTPPPPPPPGVPPPPPPPAAPSAPCQQPAAVLGGEQPVRVGGNIRPPAKVRDVRPVYPADARLAGIQGVVILEATIASDGHVAQACVLRSVPGLNEAAIEAVNQWAFTPTLLNGMPVPLVMTVTVNFTLQ